MVMPGFFFLCQDLNPEMSTMGFNLLCCLLDTFLPPSPPLISVVGEPCHTLLPLLLADTSFSTPGTLVFMLTGCPLAAQKMLYLLGILNVATPDPGLYLIW